MKKTLFFLCCVCGIAEQIVLRDSKTHFNKFERGNRDEFFVEVFNVGELTHIRYMHVAISQTGPSAAYWRKKRATKSQRGGEGRREWNERGGQGPLAKEGGLYLNICAGVPRVPSYAAADGAGLPILSHNYLMAFYSHQH